MSIVNIDFTDPPPPEKQAIEALCSLISVETPPDLIFDGVIHRFKTAKDKGGDKRGWYILFNDGRAAGAFGEWGGESATWCAEYALPMSAAERTAHEKRIKEIQHIREQEQAKRHKTAAESCAEIWERAEGCTAHPYLERKRVGAYGVRVSGDGRLIIPIYNGTELASLQFIDADGKKRFYKDGEVKGGYTAIPAQEQKTAAVYITEGYATGASVHEATGSAVIVAFNAGNLKAVGEYARKTLPKADIIFVADNDASGTGKAKADEAAAAIGATVIMPPIQGDANDYVNAGNDLQALLLSSSPRWLLSLDELMSSRQSVKWLIKGWCQAEASIMLFGASGAGKSFVALDMALSIAAQAKRDWHGLKINHGPVVYLSGEGNVGMLSRIAGWLIHNRIDKADFHMCRSPVDINTPEGLSHVIREIQQLNAKPVMIIIDTLNRFMVGDENKAQDVSELLKAQEKLKTEFHCSVMIVHHTGVDPAAQNRARGSSALRGAMDIEMQVMQVNGKIKLHMTKSKDTEIKEDLYLEPVKIEIPERYDDDGEPISTLVLEDGYAPEPERKTLSKSQQFALQTFREAAETKGKLDEDGNFAGVALEDWREVFYAQSTADNTNAKKIAFQRARKDLTEKGELYVENDIYRRGGDMGEFEERQYADKLKL